MSFPEILSEAKNNIAFSIISPSLSPNSYRDPDDKAHFNISLCLERLDKCPLNQSRCRLSQKPLSSLLILMVCRYFPQSFVEGL